jgi:hypothetical protein
MGVESGWHVWCVDWQGDDRTDSPSVVSAPDPLSAAERWAELLDAEGLSDARSRSSGIESRGVCAMRPRTLIPSET